MKPRLFTKEKPDIFHNPLEKLSPEEKGELRTLLTSKLYVKMLRAAAKFKPQARGAGIGSAERDQFSDARANARLGEIRGWELYEAAIFLVLNETKPAPSLVEATYPDAGRIDQNWGTLPPPEKKK